MQPIHILSLCLCFPLTSFAASFDCGKASLPIERTICQQSTLNQLDQKLGTAYKTLRETLPKTEFNQWKTAQQEWLAQRDMQCLETEVACLESLYQEQVAVLEFRLNPAYSQSVTGQISGEFVRDEEMSLRISALNPEEVRVEISGAEATQGRWICEFKGRGRLIENSITIQQTAEGEEPQVITLWLENEQITVKDEMAEKNGNSYFCGAGGMLDGSYRRKTN